jgi:glycyl-tRNA synthetase (class II)
VAKLQVRIQIEIQHSNSMQEAEDVLARIDELDSIGLGTALTRYGVKTPDTKNDISAPFPFNLMFRTSIGPKGDAVGYLRPETAQGIFVNFKCAAALLCDLCIACCTIRTPCPSACLLSTSIKMK